MTIIKNPLSQGLTKSIFNKIFFTEEVGEGTSAYGVLNRNPEFTADFINQKYFTNATLQDNFTSAITHVRNSNATMTDGYGPELVVNGGFDSDVSGWLTYGDAATTVVYENGRALVDGATTNDGIYQTITVEPNKTYIFEADIERQTATQILLASNANIPTNVLTTDQKTRISGQFSTTTGTSVSIRITNSSISTGTFYVDNVSVREMPVLKWAPHNLLTYSEEFNNALWSKTATTITANSATAPDGTTTADTMSHTSTIALLGRSAVSVDSGANYTLGIFVKYVDHQWFRLYAESNTEAWFDLVNGQIGTEYNTTASIQDVGNGWYHVSIDYVAPDASSTPYFLLAAGNGSVLESSGTSAYIWGAHLYRSDLGGMVNNPDQPLSRASYVPTTSSDKYLPRIGHHVYNGSAWVNEGLLAESERRVNLVPYSDFSSGFSGARTTITPDQAISPDGTENAVEIVETTDSGTHFVNNALTVTASVDYTLSVYVKQGAGNRSAILRTNNVGGDTYITFDFVSESITETGASVNSSSVVSAGNGWYRISFSYTQPAQTAGGFIVGLSNSTTPSSSLPSYTGDGTSSVFVYGAQFEEGSTPSSFCPTNGQQCTKEAESFTIPSANLPWPEPNYIGDEEVTNGTFNTNISGWTTDGEATATLSNNAILVSGSSNPINGGIYQQLTGTVSGKVYELTLDLVNEVGTGLAYVRQSSSANLGSGTDIFTEGSLNAGTHSTVFVASQDDIYLLFYTYQAGGAARSFTLDNISVREIDPLAVSIAMDGRVTYTDQGTFTDDLVFNWQESNDNSIDLRFDGNSTNVGRPLVVHRISGDQDLSGAPNVEFFEDGEPFQPFNIAGRITSTKVQGAFDGVTGTEATISNGLVDLSSTDLRLTPNYMGTIGTFRVWDRDITDDGLVEATNPSIEPSLSLTFEGTGTNSFVVNDWSE